MLRIAPFYFLVTLLFLSGCSNQKMLKMMTKSPKLGVTGNKEASWNDYQEDVQYLSHLIQTTYPKLEEKISPAEFQQATDSLMLLAGTLDNDFDFAVALQHFIARLQDGHTRININYFKKNTPTLFALLLFREDNNFIISNIDAQVDSTVLGGQVMSINGMPIMDLDQRILQYESSENEYFAFYQFQSHAYFLKYWQALGVVPKNENTLALEILTTDHEVKQVSLTASEKFNFHRVVNQPSKYDFTMRRKNNGFFTKVLEEEKIAYLQMNTCLDYVAIKSEINNYTNFLTRPLALASLKKQHRSSRNFGLLLQQLFTEIHQKNIEKLVVDLRYNSGGDERLGKQLIWYLTEREDLRGFQDYYLTSEYFRQQVKVDYKKFDRIYQEKYGRALPTDTLINVSETIYNEPYFADITRPESPFFLDASIPKFKGKVYVLIGSKTMSAAQVLATTFQDNNLGIIVGTPAGNKPTTQTGASAFKLPNTKIIAFISYLYMTRPSTSRNSEDTLYPDLTIRRKLKDIRAGIDQQWQWILEQ